MSNKNLLITQPGKMGDIILLTPIAKYYYNKGYQIDWPVFSNFVSYFDSIPYINAIDAESTLEERSYHSKKRMPMMKPGSRLSNHDDCLKYFSKVDNLRKENDYDMVLDPCWGFPGQVFTELKQRAINEYMHSQKKWITLKYKMCEVPLSERWNLSWKRNDKKEKQLLKFVKEFALKKYGSEEYSIVHTYDSPLLPKFEVKNPINFSYIKGYEIYDWLTVLENSKKIVCVDSCLCHFVETQDSLKEKEKFYLGSEEQHWSYFMYNILKNNWINLTDADIENE
tara:strand:- start:4513 stop:5358 length:846 start_codon:yes stop_codon:yes gene_type:complete